MFFRRNMRISLITNPIVSWQMHKAKTKIHDNNRIKQSLKYILHVYRVCVTQVTIPSHWFSLSLSFSFSHSGLLYCTSMLFVVVVVVAAVFSQTVSIRMTVSSWFHHNAAPHDGQHIHYMFMRNSKEKKIATTKMSKLKSKYIHTTAASAAAAKQRCYCCWITANISLKLMNISVSLCLHMCMFALKPSEYIKLFLAYM